MAAVPVLDREVEGAAERPCTDERACLEAARAGDASAVAQLYARYRPLLLGRARTRWGMWTDLAEDLAQDAWVKALAGLDGFDPDRPFVPWVEKILDNVVIDYLRATRTRGGRVRHFPLAGTDEELPQQPGRPEDPDRLADREALTSAMADLPSRQRQIALSVLVTGATVAEAAQRMELELSAGRQLLHRARKSLRRSLLEQGVLPGLLPPVVVVREWWAGVCRRYSVAAQGAGAGAGPTLAALMIAATMTVTVGETMAFAQSRPDIVAADEVTGQDDVVPPATDRPSPPPWPEMDGDAPQVVAPDAAPAPPEVPVHIPETEIPLTGVRIHSNPPTDPDYEYGVRVPASADTGAPADAELEVIVQDRRREETDPAHDAACEAAVQTAATYCTRDG